MSLDGPTCSSIADTILDFASVVLRQIAEPSGIESLRQTIELAVSVWNAHVLALPEWGQPEHLVELSRLISLSASPHMLTIFEQLSDVKRVRFPHDSRVVCDWQVTADELGRTRFDCSARKPSLRPQQSV